MNEVALAVVSDDESLPPEDPASALHSNTVNVIELLEDDGEFTDESVHDSDVEYEIEEDITVKSRAESDDKQDDDDDDESSSSNSSSSSSGPKVDIMPTILENPDSPCASSLSCNTRGSKSVVRIFGMDRIPPNNETADDAHHLLLEGDNEVWENASEMEISVSGDPFEIEEEEVDEGIENPDDESHPTLPHPFILSHPEEIRSAGGVLDVESHDGVVFVDDHDDDQSIEVLIGNETPCLLNEQAADKPSNSEDSEYDPEQPNNSHDRKRHGTISVRPAHSTMVYKHRVFTFLILFLVAMLGMALLLWLRNDSTDDDSEPSSTPTTAPTSNDLPTPPTNLYRYEKVPDGVITGQGSSVIGYSVAYSEDLLVAGVPNNSEVFWSFSDGTFQMESIRNNESNTGFGWSVDLADSRYLVTGAPFLKAAGKTTQVGGAFVYRYSLNGSWEPVGSVLRGDENIFAANSNFGSAVAIAHFGNGRLRVIAGAPDNRQDWSTSTGRVYTFERDIDLESGELLWKTIEQIPMIGDRAEVRLGMAVGISRDGSLFLAGAPGSEFATVPGYVVAYEYTSLVDDPWRLVFALRGDQPDEQFGASVALLSDNGDMIAVGAPGFDQGTGRVVVYQRGSSGLYQQLGADIIGNAQDGIGEANTLAGGINENTQPFILVATASGLVKRYDYSPESMEWEDLYETLDTGFTRITSLASTGDDAHYFAVGSADSNAVALFRSSRS